MIAHSSTFRASSESRSIARNAVLNLASRIPPLAFGFFFAVPYLVHHLGPARFGVLSIAWVTVGYFSIFDLGLGRAATRHVAHAIGAGEEWRIPNLAWTAASAQLALGVSASLVVAAITPTLVGRVLNIPAALHAEARATFYVLSLAVTLTLVTGSVRGLLEAAQRFDLVSGIGGFFAFLNFLLPCAGVWLGWSLPAITGLLVGSSALSLAIYLAMCARVYPSILVLPSFKRDELTRLFTFGSWVMVSSIVGPILIYLDQFVLGAVLSISAVGYYSPPYEFVTRFLIIPGSLVATLFPKFSGLHARGDPAEFARLVSRSLKYLVLIVGSLAAVIVPFAGEILQVWLGPSFAEKAALALQILGVGLIFNSLAQVPFALVQARNRPDISAKLHLLELPVHLALVWLLVRAYGMPGAAIAWSIRVTLDALALFAAAFRISRLSWKIVLLEKIPRTLGALVLLAFITGCIAQLLRVRWAQVAGLATALAATAGISWMYLLDPGDRAQIAEAIGLRGRVAGE